MTESLEQAFAETLRLRQLVDDEQATEIVPSLPQVRDLAKHRFDEFVEARDMLAEVFDGKDVEEVMDRIENGLIIETDRGVALSRRNPRYALTLQEATESLEAYCYAADDFTRESRDLGIIEGNDQEIVGDQESEECMSLLNDAAQRLEQLQPQVPSF